MEEVLRHAENIQNIGQMLAKIGEEKEEKDYWMVDNDQCQPNDIRASPNG